MERIRIIFDAKQTYTTAQLVNLPGTANLTDRLWPQFSKPLDVIRAYCRPLCVNFTAQNGVVAPPVTLQFCPLTEPPASVVK